VAAETLKIIMKFDKEICMDQTNIPSALTQHHAHNACDGTKTSPLNYITFNHTTGRARLTTRFRADYCSCVNLRKVTICRVDGWVHRDSLPPRRNEGQNF